MNVVHIKDSVCTLPTSILAQYLKQANGQLSSLKVIFFNRKLLYNFRRIYLLDNENFNSDVRAFRLQQLYLATGNSLSYDDNETPKERLFMENNLVCEQQLCVVCQCFPLSRALLPCRHTCICASCFTKLENCPMCRSPIKSYFCVRGEEYLPEGNEKSAPSKPERFSQWIQDRITDFLGFHR